MPASCRTAASAAPPALSSTADGAIDAIPSATSDCGAGTITIVSSSKPRPRTRSSSLQQRSAWCPGYVSWIVSSSRSMAEIGRSTLTEIRLRRSPR